MIHLCSKNCFHILCASRKGLLQNVVHRAVGSPEWQFLAPFVALMTKWWKEAHYYVTLHEPVLTYGLTFLLAPIYQRKSHTLLDTALENFLKIANLS